jgi:hypothetical protein
MLAMATYEKLQPKNMRYLSTNFVNLLHGGVPWLAKLVEKLGDVCFMVYSGISPYTYIYIHLRLYTIINTIKG